MADTVRFIISQRLVPKVGGGRLLMTEFMGSNLRTREAIIFGEGENRTFQDIIEASSTFGWHTFDQSLLKAYQESLITEDTALMCCTHKNKMGRDIDMTKKLLNADFAGSSGLKMAPAPPQNAPPPLSGIPAVKK